MPFKKSGIGAAPVATATTSSDLATSAAALTTIAGGFVNTTPLITAGMGRFHGQVIQTAGNLGTFQIEKFLKGAIPVRGPAVPIGALGVPVLFDFPIAARAARVRINGPAVGAATFQAIQEADSAT